MSIPGSQMQRALGQGPLYEFILFGSVSETELPSLLHRLRGLCEFSTCGGIQFTDKELTYKIGTTVTDVDVRNTCLIFQKLQTFDLL